jgi:hypothetical protein
VSSNRLAARRESAADAARWLDDAVGGEPIPPLLVAVGVGEGRVLDLLEERAPDTRVLVLEPDRATANAFSKRRDWSRWRKSGRLAYLVGPDYAGADQAWRVFPRVPEAFKLLLHPSLAKDRDRILGALQVFKRIQFGVRANADARRRFAPRYLANVIRNAPAIVAGSDVRALTNAFPGVPAVIAAAGPSLDNAIDDLRAVQGRAVFIAVDTALRPLLHAGLTPHLVVGADPGTANARHFQELPDCPDTWLLSESALDRAATSIFDGRTFWFRLAKHHPWPFLHELGIETGLMEMWGSVLTAAFQVACLAGCDPIVMVGADLAFTGGRPYCRGTTYEFDWARETASGRALDDVWNTWTSRYKPTRAPDVYGQDTATTGSMQSFRDWMLAAAKRSGRRVINATGGGTLFGDHIEQSSLLAVLPDTQVPVSLDSIARLPPSSIDLPELARHLTEVQSALEVRGSATSPVADWAEFLGDVYIPAAIAAALQASIEEVDGARPHRRVGATINWSSMRTRELLTRLPETLARFGNRLTAAAPARESGGLETVADRPALLADALGLLHSICLEARQLDRLRLAGDAWQLTRVPISAMYEWPDAIKWRVELFEATLEGVWPSPIADGPSSYVSRGVRLCDANAVASEFRIAPTPRDRAAHACALLVLEWLRCASTSQSDVVRILVPMAHSIVAMSAASAKAPQAGATLAISLQVAASPDRIDLTAPVAAAAFARHVTGTLGEPNRASFELVSATTDLFHVSIALQPLGADRTGTAPAIARPKVLRIAPRVLTDEGVPGALVTHRRSDGVACVLFQRPESVVVRPDGSIRSLHRWPRPIVNELPLGDGGAVAWGDGLSGYPDRVESGYVMYKRDPEGEIAVQELPVRPTIGRWWQGRFYWNCHPRRVESPTGLVSWAPGDDSPKWELPELPTTLGMHTGDEGLLFELGGGPIQGGRWQRRFGLEGLTWRPGSDLHPTKLGPYGVASARDASGMWTATAHPEADLIHLESANGRRVSMACYYPIGLGWLGDSLLVGTIELELLLFENLLTRLETMPV